LNTQGSSATQPCVEFRRRIDDRAISGEIGLARQHVHALRTRDARRQFHRECRNLRTGKFRKRGVVAVWIEHADDERARLVVCEFGFRGTAHLQDNVGVLGDNTARDLRTGRSEIRVGNAGGVPRALLDRNLGPESDETLDGVGRGRDARLAGFSLRWNGNLHARPESLGSAPVTGRERNGWKALSEDKDKQECQHENHPDDGPFRDGQEGFVHSLVLGIVIARGRGIFVLAVLRHVASRHSVRADWTKDLAESGGRGNAKRMRMIPSPHENDR
jgi:hypothetical protein